MDFNMIIAIISITITGISVFVAAYQIYIQGKPFTIISQGRKTALTGDWIGEFIQNNQLDGAQIGGKMELHLSLGKRKIKGLIKVKESHFNSNAQLIVEGGFKSDRFLFLNYKSKKITVTQFGYYLLELSSNAKRLKGKIIGYGPESEKIITIDVEFQKLKTKL